MKSSSCLFLVLVTVTSMFGDVASCRGVRTMTYRVARGKVCEDLPGAYSDWDVLDFILEHPSRVCHFDTCDDLKSHRGSNYCTFGDGECISAEPWVFEKAADLEKNHGKALTLSGLFMSNYTDYIDEKFGVFVANKVDFFKTDADYVIPSKPVG